jgi:nicotinate phosphoribosyltransferase
MTNRLKHLYGHSLALLTDLYQLTMACGYWKSGQLEQEAVFHLFFRRAPFGGQYCIAAGLASVVEYLEDLRFTEEDVAYLATLRGNDGNTLFPKEFLEYLLQLRFDCDIDALPEGTIVFPHEPLLRIQGSLLQCQLLETALLNILNFQTLIATKTVRICQAAYPDPVLEFGLRRAQGIDGGIAASRAAYIGGCVGTSNVLAGKLYDIPLKGTHAHSWVMSFPSEQIAFQTYVESLPNNCTLLVDTYNTLDGVRQAIQAGQWLRERGYKFAGVRLDSGDFVSLSQQARILLDNAGFTETAIVASNDLDEYSIQELKQAGAKINMWGIGTKLVTAYDQAALGGVYKLSALRRGHQAWQYRLKLSEEPIKVSTPGILQIRRFQDAQGNFIGDMLYNIQQVPKNSAEFITLHHTQQAITLPEHTVSSDLLIPVIRQGRCVMDLPTLIEIREHVQSQLRRVSSSDYPVGLERQLHETKMKMIATLR